LQPGGTVNLFFFLFRVHRIDLRRPTPAEDNKHNGFDLGCNGYCCNKSRCGRTLTVTQPATGRQQSSLRVEKSHPTVPAASVRGGLARVLWIYDPICRCGGDQMSSVCEFTVWFFFFLSSIIFGGDGALVLVLIRKFH
jgi:hypothetical protein